MYSESNWSEGVGKILAQRETEGSLMVKSLLKKYENKKGLCAPIYAESLESGLYQKMKTKQELFLHSLSSDLIDLQKKIKQCGEQRNILREQTLKPQKRYILDPMTAIKSCLNNY